MTTWADLLQKLPTIKPSESDGTLLLKVETDSMRVWLCEDEGCANGNPFARTVYVEQLRSHPTLPGGYWADVGYFDGDEDDPHPTGLLGEAYAETLTRRAVQIQEPDRPDEIIARLLWNSGTAHKMVPKLAQAIIDALAEKGWRIVRKLDE